MCQSIGERLSKKIMIIAKQKSLLKLFETIDINLYDNKYSNEWMHACLTVELILNIFETE